MQHLPYQPPVDEDVARDRDRSDALWLAGLTLFIAACAVIVIIAQLVHWIAR